jgi:hypothetical protein
MEAMTEQIVDLTGQLLEMKATVGELKKRERRLRGMVTTLSKQLVRLNEEPEVSLDDLSE